MYEKLGLTLKLRFHRVLATDSFNSRQEIDLPHEVDGYCNEYNKYTANPNHRKHPHADIIVLWNYAHHFSFECFKHTFNSHRNKYVAFEVEVLKVGYIVFCWVTALCHLVGGYQLFRSAGTHLQDQNRIEYKTGSHISNPRTYTRLNIYYSPLVQGSDWSFSVAWLVKKFSTCKNMNCHHRVQKWLLLYLFLSHLSSVNTCTPFS